MNIRRNLGFVVMLFAGAMSLNSCASKRFSHKFIDRYISDSVWLYQLNYVPACNFTLQASKLEIDFKQNATGHFIYRKRDIDEFVFTPVSTGVLRKMSNDTLWIQFSEQPESILRFVRNKNEDAYYLFPDTIVADRFLIRYQNRNCISEKKLPQIKLNVQGIEITKVNKNRLIQKGIKPEDIKNANDSLTE